MTGTNQEFMFWSLVMTLKNRYLKRCRISEWKIRPIIKLFVNDRNNLEKAVARESYGYQK